MTLGLATYLRSICRGFAALSGFGFSIHTGSRINTNVLHRWLEIVLCKLQPRHFHLHLIRGSASSFLSLTRDQSCLRNLAVGILSSAMPEMANTTLPGIRRHVFDNILRYTLTHRTRAAQYLYYATIRLPVVEHH